MKAVAACCFAAILVIAVYADEPNFDNDRSGANFNQGKSQPEFDQGENNRPSVTVDNRPVSSNRRRRNDQPNFDNGQSGQPRFDGDDRPRYDNDNGNSRNGPPTIDNNAPVQRTKRQATNTNSNQPIRTSDAVGANRDIQQSQEFCRNMGSDPCSGANANLPVCSSDKAYKNNCYFLVDKNCNGKTELRRRACTPALLATLPK